MKRLLFLLVVLLWVDVVYSQCSLIDGQGLDSNNPVWVSCSGSDFTLFIQSNDTYNGAVTIDWGDGSPVQNLASLIPPAFVTHTYTAAVTNYTVTFTAPGNACVITGTVVMEEPVNASIQIPIGGVTQICAPQDMDFINSSTDVSSNTIFTWDFGDGSPPLVFGDTNLGQTVTNTYQQGTVDCATQVTLTAENFCSFGNPTEASFNPVLIYDLDDAAIAASAVLLCYPDTVVHFDNVTDRNCVPEGNVDQRYEYWNFGNYWGTGQDSIIDWLPFAPPNRPGYDISFPGIGTYTIMMIDSNQCGQDTAYITVQIVNAPTAAVAAAIDTICEGQSITFINQSNGANQYNWNFGDGGGFEGFTGNGGNMTHTYNNAGTYVVQVVANIAGGTNACLDTAQVTITVKPSPTADINLTPSSGCDSLTVTFTDASTSAIQWNWSFGNGSTSTLQNPAPQDYLTSGSKNVTLMVTSANGCTDNDNATVNVFESPVIGIIPNNICENTVSQFTDNSTVGFGGPINAWSWDFGDGNSSNQQNPTHSFGSNGTFTITLTASTNQCFATDSITVTVEPQPTVAFTPDTTFGCSPLPVNFANTTTGAVTYSWNFGDGGTSTATNPSNTYINNSGVDITRTVKLVATSTFGCQDSTTTTIDVFPNPIGGFTSNAVADCAPLEVQFTDNSVGAVSYIWDFGDTTGSVLQNPSKIFTNNTQFITNYTVTQIAVSNNGCTDTSTQIISVFPEPDFTFVSLPDSGCSPLSVTFPFVNAQPPFPHFWDFGDGDTLLATSPSLVSHTYTNTTTNNQVFNVLFTATSAFGCTDTSFLDVVVFPKPSSAFTLDIDSGCHPLPVTFQNLSSGGDSTIWDFGDGDTSFTDSGTVFHTFENFGSTSTTYPVNLYILTDKGCSDTATQLVEVNPYVVAGFTSDTIGCHPLTIAFTDTSINAATHSWDFGDGSSSTLASPTHVFQNLTNATVQYTVSLVVVSQEGCLDSTTQTITVYPKPTAQFTPSSLAGCHPHPVEFYDQSVLKFAANWQFGDGDSSISLNDTILHTYSNQTNDSLFFPVTLVVTSSDGCLDSATSEITVYPEIIAGFIPLDTIGCHPFPVSFTDTSTLTDVYDWDFGDGNSSTLASPTHVFQNLGTTTLLFTVKQVVTSIEGCQDSATHNITVYPKPTAQFTPSSLAGCHPHPVEFYDQSILKFAANWQFGDGDSSISLNDTVPHTYSNQTNDSLFFPITLVVTSSDGCLDTATSEITVYPEIIAGFIPLDTIGCHPFPVSFTDTSTLTDVYDWDFGDGNSSTLASPTHVFQNLGASTVLFTVKQVVTSIEGCQDSATHNITVYPKPTAQFTPSSLAGCHPHPVEFYDQSLLKFAVNWQFGDGDSSVSLNDTIPHIYSNQTNDSLFFPVTLLVTSVDGCLDTATSEITVYPEVIADFLPSDTIGCHPFVVSFTDASTLPNVYAWDFGDGSPINTTASPTHVFQNLTAVDIVYPVELVVTSIEQCTDTANTTVRVHPKPTASFGTSITVGCHPLEVDFSNNALLDDFVIWDFDDGDSNTTLNNTVTHVFSNTTLDTLFFDVKLIVSTVNGCSDTINQVITVYPQIIADFTVAPDVGCSPMFTQFTDISTNALLYNWDFGDSSPTSISGSPFHTYTNPNTFTGGATVFYDARLIVTSTEGCMDTAETVITVFSKPNAAFNAQPDQVCHGLPVALTNTSSNNPINRWYLGFGDTLVTNAAVVDTVFSNTGSAPQFYTVTLTTQTINGCLDTADQQIAVFPRVLADFEMPDEGCHPLPVDFINNSSGAISGATYAWNYGDNTPTEFGFDPSHTFNNVTTVDAIYNVTLTVTSIFGCGSQLTKPITIHPQPVANFTATPISQQFPDATVNFANTTNAGSWTYSWNFGDTTFSSLENPGDHIYDTWGNFTVTLTVSSPFCSDEISQVVEIIPPLPIPDFEGSAIGCRPVTIEFENLSTYGVTYRWEFGDGGISSQEEPIYTYFNVGSYDVTLTVTGPGGDQVTIVRPNAVTVNEFASALFDFNPKTATIPTQPISFFNLSNFADSYLWDFGDGNTSTEENPEHFYQVAGEYTVTLIADNEAGCADEFEHPTTAIARIAGEIVVPNAFTPNSGGGSGGGVFDPNSITNEIFFPILSGILEEGYELTIFNRWGELLFQTNEINVGWDGYYRGQLCQQDVYVWKIKARLVDGQEVRKVGDLTLLR